MRRIAAGLAALGLLAITAAVVVAAATGVGNIRDMNAQSDKITVALSGFPALAANQAYEGWLVNRDSQEKLSLGIFNLDASGGGTFEFVSPAGDNLIGDYDNLVVTIEPVPDDDPGPSGNPAARDTIPAGSMAHIRHLLSGWPPSPGGNGLAVGQRSQAEVLLAHANLASQSAQDGDLDGAKNHSEHVVNIAEGSNGANFGDLNGDGNAQNPGDGFGVITYANDAAKHAGFAAGTDDADSEVKLHGQHVADTSNNVAMWAAGARDKALDVLNATDVSMAQTYTSQVVEYAQMALEGNDANGNGSIEPVPGEGGAQTAYVHAQLMAQYNLVETAAAPAAGEAPTLPRTGGAEVPLPGIVAGVILLAAAGMMLARQRIRSRA